ncbi:MAG: HAMP domain-containing sensor histidine kinase [Cyclobacteriaceae bacterium]
MSRTDSSNNYQLSTPGNLVNENLQHANLISRLAIIMMVVTVAYFALYIIYGFNAPWPVFAMFAFISVVSYFLVKANKLNFAKIFGLTGFNTVVYLVASSETHLTNVNLYFITGGIGALVLYDYNERIKSFGFIVYSFSLYALARFSSYTLLPVRDFTSDEVSLISLFNLTVFSYVTAYLVILLLKGNYLKKEDLKRQNSELLKINKELDRFIYSSSHDLRAPLSSLLGLIHLTELEPDDSLKKEYLKMMHGRITAMDLFIKEIIDYAKNARHEAEHTLIALNEEIQKIIHELKYMEGANLVTIRCTGLENIEMNGDLMRIRIVLTNLISNAIKYRDKSKEKCALHINASLESHSVSIEFKDNGIGISPSHHEKIFAMFYRAHETSTGSGLGLYLVRETLNNLKGSIKIISEVGKGSSFTIALPLNASGSA